MPSIAPILPVLSGIAQVSGALALATFVLGYLPRDPRRVCALHCVSGIFMTIYLAVGHAALGPAAIALVAVVRDAAGAFASPHALPRLVAGAWTIQVCTALAWFDAPVESLPILATTLAALAVGLRDRPLPFRGAKLAALATWLVYAALIGSTALVLRFGLALVTCTIGLLRTDLANRHRPGSAD